jgi:phospholipid-translocating ATPase
VFKLEVGGGEGQRESLGLENTLWCNTFLAAGKAKALVLYTGKQCRSALNSREPRSKMGRIDQELNYLSKLLCAFLCDIAFIIVLCKGFKDMWLLDFFRHVLLLSSIIPISLRVNLDVAKMYYCYCINHDPDIEGALARNSTIPEELGRVSYILTDKTGTLT